MWQRIQELRLGFDLEVYGRKDFPSMLDVLCLVWTQTPSHIIEHYPQEHQSLICA